MPEPHQRLMSPIIVAQRIAYEDEEEWSEAEASYGSGGYRINREKLADIIRRAIEAERLRS